MRRFFIEDALFLLLKCGDFVRDRWFGRTFAIIGILHSIACERNSRGSRAKVAIMFRAMNPRRASSFAVYPRAFSE